MENYFIIDFIARKTSDINNKRYSMMTFADTLKDLSNTIVHLSKSWLEKEGYERVYIKVWKWEAEETTYMFGGVIYDYDPKTIRF